MKKWAFLLGLTMSLSTQAEPIIRIFEMQIRPESVEQFTELGKHNIRRCVGNVCNDRQKRPKQILCRGSLC